MGVFRAGSAGGAKKTSSGSAGSLRGLGESLAF